MKLKSIRFFAAALLILTVNTFSYSAEPLEGEFLYALDLFKEARYDQALRLFHTVVDDPDSWEYHGDADYWIIRCNLEMNNLDRASKQLEDYLIAYPNHKHNEDARYYKGRVLFLQNEFDKSIHFYSSFLTTFPKSPYFPSALFWIGESLYSMGRFDEAEEIYESLLERYPRSVKVEASRYRLALIEYRNREEELLKLLQWSHEEFLKSSGEYEQKEKEFNQALAVYQDRLIELTKTKEVYENRLKLLLLKEEALRLKEKMLAGGTTDNE